MAFRARPALYTPRQFTSQHITDIYMHKFNTFAHDIQVNHFSNAVTSLALPYFLLATIPSYDCSQIAPL